MTQDFPADTLQAMALYLARHMDRVRQHEAAADIAAEITAAVRQAVRAIDRPAQRVYAGPCPTCRTDLLTQPGRIHVTCIGCGTTYDIAERQEHMRTQLDDYLGTAAYAAAILPGIGVHVTAGTIRVWASRHRLEVRVIVPAHATGPEQHLFRLGDIIDLALARDTRAGLAVTAIVLQGDARRLPLPDASVDLIVTSPPYFGLRSYTDGGEHYGGQIGSESTPQEWGTALIECTAEWMRVLKPSGSMFINLGDKYAAGHGGSSTEGEGVTIRKRSTFAANPRERPDLPDPPASWSTRDMTGRNVVPGTRPKSLLGLPWRYALAATDQLGLILRRDIIWAKPNGLPESVTDRCRSSHEYLFHFTVQPRYYAAVDEIREAHEHHRRDTWDRRPPDINGQRAAGNGDARVGNNPLGKLPGSVWNIPSQPLTVPPHLGVDHFAAFPMELPRRCILGWSPPGICVACGEGRRPVVDRDRQPTQRVHNGRSAKNPGDHNWAGSVLPHRTLVTITGYECACPTQETGHTMAMICPWCRDGDHVRCTQRPPCRCEDPFHAPKPPPIRPAVVLDPFGGTGTTALVASMHGRIGISVDRSADYTRLATWRTHDPAERAKALQVPKPPPIMDGQDALFDLG